MPRSTRKYIPEYVIKRCHYAWYKRDHAAQLLHQGPAQKVANRQQHARGRIHLHVNILGASRLQGFVNNGRQF